MDATGTFVVSNQTHIGGPPAVRAGLTLGHFHMVKTFSGDIEGQAFTEFTGAMDADTDTGTYVAMETFEGSLHGLEGTMLLAHMSTMDGGHITDEDHHLVIVPGSGTHELSGIRGRGRIHVSTDGTHTLSLTYEFRLSA